VNEFANEWNLFGVVNESGSERNGWRVNESCWTFTLCGMKMREIFNKMQNLHANVWGLKSENGEKFIVNLLNLLSLSCSFRALTVSTT
jgi:hypothetical protein